MTNPEEYIPLLSGAHESKDSAYHEPGGAEEEYASDGEDSKGSGVLDLVIQCARSVGLHVQLLYTAKEPYDKIFASAIQTSLEQKNIVISILSGDNEIYREFVIKAWDNLFGIFCAENRDEYNSSKELSDSVWKSFVFFSQEVLNYALNLAQNDEENDQNNFDGEVTVMTDRLGYTNLDNDDDVGEGDGEGDDD